MRHSPALLLYHEDTLAPRIEFIKRLFPETPRLLSRAPLLLTHDPETFLLPKIKQLESLLPGVDVLKVVRWGHLSHCRIKQFERSDLPCNTAASWRLHCGHGIT